MIYSKKLYYPTAKQNRKSELEYTGNY